MSMFYKLTSYLPSFFYSQLFNTPPPPTTPCTSRTFIVTGANTGLGKAAAAHFARLGAGRIVLACRDEAKGAAAKREIDASLPDGGVGTAVEVWPLDLSCYDSVRAFAARVNALDRVDVVLENAGLATKDFRLAEGEEMTVTVNVISTFLLAFLVLPKLQETARKFNVSPVLTIVSSEAHFITTFPERHAPDLFAALSDPARARMHERYAVTKLLEVLCVRELARRNPRPADGVIVNTVNPGFCVSELMRDLVPAPLRVLLRVLQRSTDVGGGIVAAAALEGSETHGAYLSDGRVATCAPLVVGPEGEALQRGVWEGLVRKLEGIEAGVTRGW